MSTTRDPQLATAIEHWAPRFVANGADANDLEEIARQLEHWDGWCAAWSAIGARHEALGRAALADGRHRSAGEHLAQAATSYHFGKFLFVHRPEEARAAHGAAVRCLTDALAWLDPPGRRELVPFCGSHLVGVLRLPPGPGARPVVVLVPGLDSTKEEFRLVEASFLDRGVGTFALDGPGQGEAEYDLSIRPDWEVPIGVVLDHLSALPDVDAERIGIWGVSLGGYYAAPGGERGRAPPRLHRPRRALRARPRLGAPAEPDARRLPGTLARRLSGGGARPGGRAHAGGPARGDPLPAARGVRQA